MIIDDAFVRGLPAMRHVVAHFWKLADASPDEHRIDLAMALTALSLLLGRPGSDESLAVAKEAVACYRLIVETHPSYLPDLGETLYNLGLELNSIGREEEAFAAMVEAHDIFCELWHRNHPAFKSECCAALVDVIVLSKRLAQQGKTWAANPKTALEHLGIKSFYRPAD